VILGEDFLYLFLCYYLNIYNLSLFEKNMEEYYAIRLEGGKNIYLRYCDNRLTPLGDPELASVNLLRIDRLQEVDLEDEKGSVREAREKK